MGERKKKEFKEYEDLEHYRKGNRKKNSSYTKRI